jgi:hypothetical protein
MSHAPAKAVPSSRLVSKEAPTDGRAPRTRVLTRVLPPGPVATASGLHVRLALGTVQFLPTHYVPLSSHAI